LEQHGITHVLSIIDESNAPVYDPGLRLVHHRVGIEDYDLVDLLEHIGGLCAYAESIVDGSQKSTKEATDGANPHAQERDVAERTEIQDNEHVSKQDDSSQRPARLLVHCLQGVSRSGSVVIGLLMRRLNLTFDDAQTLARKYRPIIGPNQGWVEQLRLWREMDFDIYEEKDGKRVLKKRYTEWKENRGVLVSKQQDEGIKMARKSMAILAARVGGLRMEEKERQIE
jgi:dual specificity phosphatase 12